MGRDQKRQWIKHLDITRNEYALELKQRDHNQKLIPRYLISTDESVYSDLERDYNEDIAEDIDSLCLHIQSIELTDSKLEGECGEEVEKPNGACTYK